MDKIYSRKRLKIPSSKIYCIENKKIRKILSIILILLIAVFTVMTLMKSINPIFEGHCKQKANLFATDIVNIKSTEVLAKYEYADLVKIESNETDNTKILKTDVSVINQIASDIAVEVSNQLKNTEGKIEIPIGAILGNKYLAGAGPKIDIKVIPSGKIETELKTEFESVGINQSVYRIYLELVCDMEILTPYNELQEKVINQVLLVETVIVGEIPETYYNLEGIDEGSVMEVME